MATYLPGVTDVMPQTDLFTPDFDMMGRSLSSLQERYNEGFSQVKGLYNSLLNAPVSSADNQQMREQFFKKVREQMAGLSKMDLGISQNVTQANNVFTPLISDREFQTDLYKTRQQQAQIQKMEAVKNSSDEKIRAQYDPAAEQYLMMGLQKMQRARRQGSAGPEDHTIDQVGVHEFVPFTDLNKYVRELTGKDGLKVTRDTISGLYKFTQTNGEAMAPAFADWVRTALGNKFDRQFEIQAYVGVEGQIEQMRAMGMSRKDAVRQVAQQSHLPLVVDYDGHLEAMREQVSLYDQQVRDIVAQHGGKIPKNSPLVAQLEAIKQAKASLQTELTTGERERGSREELANRMYESIIQNPARALVPYYKSQFAQAWGQREALANSELKISGDDVGMMKYKEQAAMSRIQFSEGQQNARQSQKIAADRRALFEGKSLDLRNTLAEHQFKLDNGITTGGAGGNGMDTSAGSAEVMIGQSADSGQALSLYEVHQKRQQQGHQAILGRVTNKTALSVAAGARFDNNGNPADPTFDPGTVQSALTRAYKAEMMGEGRLSAADKAVLDNYMRRVVGKPFTNVSDALLYIEAGVSKRSTSYAPDVAETASRSMSGAFRGTREIANEEAALQQHYRNLIRQDADYAQEFERGPGGKLTPRPGSKLVANAVPNPNYLSQFTGQRKPNLVITAPVEDMPVLFTGIASAAQGLGYVNDDGTVTYLKDKELRENKSRLQNLSSNNYKDIFGPGMTVREINENGHKEYEVIVGVNRSMGENGMSAGEHYLASSLAKGVANNNKLVFRMSPQAFEQHFGRGTAVYRNKKGQMVKIPDLVNEMAQQMTSDTPIAGGKLPGITALANEDYQLALPMDLQAVGIKGYLKRDGDQIVYFDQATGTFLPLKDVSYQQLSQNPVAYGDVIYDNLHRVGVNMRRLQSQSSQTTRQANQNRAAQSPYDYYNVEEQYPELFPHAKR